MLRQDSARIDPPNPEEPSNHSQPPVNGPGGIDIQRELNRIEDMIFDSPHIPFTRRTLVDEEMLLAQLDLVRENLPDTFAVAQKIVRQREGILLQAEEYAQELVEAAEQRADQLLDELGIVQQAELEAYQIRQKVQQECEALQQQTLSEIERLRRQAQQEIEQVRLLALAECEDIQNGADEYADAVLRSIEQQLGDMLRVIRNGRQQLLGDPPQGNIPETDANGGSGLR
ncbi:DivIVA domain-containing protein [Lyngbya aestuarii]|uniref:DivIVA domain-containing protein n=1 Tax=Lyngbya aestuarii TaxID=118322 RepID=UPI00403DBD96